MGKKLKVFISLFLAVAFVFSLAACSDKEDSMEIVTAQSKLATLEKEAKGGVIKDSSGNATFASGNNHFTTWGVENDQWQTMNKSKNFIDRYIDASLNVNANTIALHMPWGVLEPEEGIYDVGAKSYLQYCVDKAREANLKIVVYFTSTNYASGDGTFVPSYIRGDKNKYTRIVIPGKYDGNDLAYITDEKGNILVDKISYCISDPDLIEREKKATEELFKFIKKNNDDGIFVAVNIASEADYSRNWDSGMSIVDVRCECDNCNKIFRKGEGNENETNIGFMTRTFNGYIKTMVDVAAETYDKVAMYTPVAALTWFGGGRYVEQPDKIKATVNRDNFFVCPSIAPTSNYALYEQEMSFFKEIEGNASFASGIDTGHDGIPHNNQAHLEIAPWYSILNDGGLGAIYWDYPLSGENGDTRSVLNKDNAIVKRLKLGWAPLKAADFYISRFKKDTEVLNWWSYEEHQKAFELGTFKVSVNRNAEDWDEHANYGIAILNDKKDLMIAATDYEVQDGENNDVVIEREGGFGGFKFEVGHTNQKGEWIKTGNFSPKTDGDKMTISVSNGGDYTKAMYRIYKK